MEIVEKARRLVTCGSSTTIAIGTALEGAHTYDVECKLGHVGAVTALGIFLHFERGGDAYE